MTDQPKDQKKQAGQKVSGKEKMREKADGLAQRVKEKIVIPQKQVEELFNPILEKYKKAGLKLSLEKETELRVKFQETINDFSSTPLPSTRIEQAQRLLDERLNTLLEHQRELETAIEEALATQLTRLLPQITMANSVAASAQIAAAEAAQETREATERAVKAERQIASQAQKISEQNIKLQTAETSIREAGRVIHDMLSEQNKKTITPPIKTKAVSDAIAAASKILVDLNRSDKAQKAGEDQTPTKTKTITTNSPAYKNFAKLMNALTTQNEKDQVIAHIQSSLVSSLITHDSKTKDPKHSSSKGRDNQKVFLNLVKSQFEKKNTADLMKEWKNLDTLKKNYTDTNRNIIPKLPEFLPGKKREAPISSTRLQQLTHLAKIATTLQTSNNPREATRAMFAAIGRIQAELKQEHNYLGSKLDKMLIKMEEDLKKGLMPATLTQNEIKVAKEHGAAQAVTEKAVKKASSKK